MTLIRPNGLVERLPRSGETGAKFSGYGRSQPGPTPESVRAATHQDRRRSRRPKSDQLRGRLIDLIV